MVKIKFHNHGFTLIELLVVISVIALLMSILMPSLGKVREQSRQVVCGTNLHAISQGIFIYANDNDDRLIPGDFSIPWAVWADMEGQCEAGLGFRQVNLGYLMTAASLPTPESEKTVFFCPSMTPRTAMDALGHKYFDYEAFDACWRKEADPAPVNYMFNTALDGFGNSVLSGSGGILSHHDRIQYLMADGSGHSFKVRPVVYDPAIGAELLQEVSQRTGLNFPSVMLHEWLVKGDVDINEAADYLADPAGWMNANASSGIQETASGVRLSTVASTSLVCDVVGAWDAPQVGTPPVPG